MAKNKWYYFLDFFTVYCFSFANKFKQEPTNKSWQVKFQLFPDQ